MNDVRELLERAVEDAGPPAVSAEAVYAQAARVRWRRRAALGTAALTVVVAAGAVAVPGIVAGDGGASSVAAPAESGGSSAPARRLTELLPDDVGFVEQVDRSAILKAGLAPGRPERTLGPLDGVYAVRRDRGVGYLAISVRSRVSAEAETGGSGRPGDPCVDGRGYRRLDCVREELPDGRVLTTWHTPLADGEGGRPRWGEEFTGQLTLADGLALFARDSTGFEGAGALGPVMKTAPLTRGQFRDLLLQPELLP